jgi:hypothetical protein
VNTNLPQSDDARRIAVLRSACRRVRDLEILRGEIAFDCTMSADKLRAVEVELTVARRELANAVADAMTSEAA